MIVSRLGKEEDGEEKVVKALLAKVITSEAIFLTKVQGKMLQ